MESSLTFPQFHSTAATWKMVTLYMIATAQNGKDKSKEFS